MSLIDTSSPFSFSQYKPTLSPCSNFIAFINTSKVIIRSAHTLERLRTISLSKQFTKVSQLTWEPLFEGKCTKLAVLISNEQRIKIVDVEDTTVDVEFQEDDVSDICHFEWLTQGKSPVETAYRGCKQIAVFNTLGLLMKLYSLDNRDCLLELAKPLTGLIQRTDGTCLWSVVSHSGMKLVVNHYENIGSHSRLVYKSELSGITNLGKYLQSPNSRWLLCTDELLNGVNINLYTIMGDITGVIGPVLKYHNNSDLLEMTQWLFIDDDTLCYGDHLARVHILKVSKGLQSVQTLKHPSVLKNGNVWRQNGQCSKYSHRPIPFSIPQLSLSRCDRGVNRLHHAAGYLLTTTEMMLSTVFIWGIGQDEPLGAIIMNTKILDVVIPSSLVPMAVITSDDSITVWQGDQLPVCIPLSLPSGSSLRGCQIIRASQSSISMMIYTSDRAMFTVQIKLGSIGSQFENMDTQEISLLRRGSPMLTDDLTKVVELAAAVQQREWGQTSALQVDDTFQGRHK